MPSKVAWWSQETLAIGGRGFVITLLLVLLLPLLLPKAQRRLLKVPLISLLLFMVCEGLRLASADHPVWSRAFRVMAMFFVLVAMGRAAFVLIFHSRFSGRFAESLPKIFRDIIQVIIYAGVMMATLHELGVEPGSLLTTSALITAVIGLSLQDTLGNLFAGLALEAQEPFEVGDWVMFEGDRATAGQVVEMNWRATKVLTLDQVEIIVPNATIAKAALRNFSKPTPLMRRTVSVAANFSTPPERVKRAMLEALADVPGVLKTPEPSVIVTGFGESRVEYALRYFIDDYRAADTTDSRVRERIWYTFKRCNLAFPIPQRDLHMHQITHESLARDEAERHAVRREALARVNLFEVLSHDELDKLAAETQTRLFAPGEIILRQGEDGSEMFVILSGEVAVSVDQNSSTSQELARLEKGHFFGEMSLMTGQARSATVRALTECELLVVAHAPFKRLLETRPELLERFSNLLAERQLALEQQHSRESMRARAARQDETSKVLFDRIRQFFSL